MIIYAFDTGISTGIAEFNTNSKRCTLLTLDADKVNLFIFGASFNPDIVVLERIPKSSKYELMKIFKEVESRSKELKSYVIITAPSQWKPVSKARGWKYSLGETIHERDAFMQLRYYMWSHHHHDIGDV